MNNQISTHTNVSWTWADAFLTYRFWGLLFLYLSSLASSGVLFTWLPLHLRATSSISTASMGAVSYTGTIAALVGFYIAWAGTRRKTKMMLLLAGMLELVGGLLLTLKDPFTAVQFRFLGAVLLGMGTGAITLSVPAILAGGMRNAQAFVIAFGFLFAVARVPEDILIGAVGSSWERLGSDALTATTSILTSLGLLALLPVNPEFFTKPPRARTCNWVVRPRNPVDVALGSIITPVYYYLIYRLHGEVVSLRPSPKILSPRGALFTLLVFPFFFVTTSGIILVSTVDRMDDYAWLLIVGVMLVPTMLSSIVITALVVPLNELAEEHVKRSLIAPWVIFVFSILFPPVAMGLIQRTLNKSILITEQGAV